MKSKRLNWIFSLFFLFAVSGNILESADLKNILKEPVEQSADSSAQQGGKGTNLSQTTLSSSPEKSAVFSQSVTFVANVFATRLSDSVPTGSVRFQIDNVPVATQPLINGTAKFTTSSLATTLSTRHYIEAIYLGDDNFASSRSDMVFAVLPADTEAVIRAQPNPSSFKKPANFTANISSKAPAVATPTGSVQFYIDAVNVETVNLDANGKASFSTSDMSVGKHAVTVIYQNNENFIGSKADVVQEVERANSTTQMMTLQNPSLYGQSVTFQAKVSSDVGTPSGMMQFLVDGTNYEAPVHLDGNGQASISIQNWASGSHTVQAYYVGDDHFNPSQTSLVQEVNPAPTKLALISSDNPSTYGQSLGVTAKIESPNLPPVGYIQFRVDGKVYGSPQPLPRNGQVTINVSQLKAGNHEIVADYLGDDNFISSSATLTQQVKRAKTTGLTSSENPSTYGDSVRITATVTAEEDLVPTGLVQFKINEKEFGKPQMLKNGQSVINISELDAGSYKIEVDYLGNENFSPSHASLIQQINKVKTDVEIYSISPSIYGQPVKALATVSARKIMPIGSVQFKLNGENYGEPQVLSKRGQATITFDNLDAGSYKIEVSYLGNENFTASNAGLIQQINKAQTRTAIYSANPSIYGQPVKVLVAVSARDLIPVGAVQFRLNEENYGEPQALSEKGQTSIIFDKFKAGLHQIEALYLGNQNFTSSEADLTQQVNKAETATSIASSANPVILGDPVTFTATVTASEPTKGTIQFKIDGQDAGNPLIVDEHNQATLTVSTGLKEGMQEVIAAFSGDENFNPSTSLPLMQVAKVAIFPPSEAQGFQVENPLRTEAKQVNVIKWTAPDKGAPPSAYRIYADEERKILIATIAADRPLEFIDPVRKQEDLYQYFIVSVDNVGNESEPIVVKITPAVPEEKDKAQELPKEKEEQRKEVQEQTKKPIGQ